MEQTQNKKISLLNLILVVVIAFGFAFSVPVKAFAEEMNPKTPEEIAEQSYLFGFKKGEDETRGRFIFALYYVPNEVYNENYTYGVIIFPKLYMERFDVHSDYINKFAELNRAILNVQGSSYQPADSGKVFRCGIGRILEKNMSLTFAFIGYVMDSEGNTAYTAPAYADYNSLNATNLSDEAVLELLNQQKGMKDNFGQITNKISELVDSIWIYLVIAAGSIIVIWGVYIGIRVAIAKKNEEKINAKDMVKHLIVGVVIAFVFAGGLPLLIKGLAAWIGG